MKFRKKPVVIDAIQWNGTIGGMMDIKEFTGGNSKMSGDGSLSIYTLEGTMKASPQDWIIKGVKGEFYPIKPDIFEETYERQPDGNIHTVPLDDTQPHLESAQCWCQPVMIERALETGIEVWSHNRARDSLQ